VAVVEDSVAALEVVGEAASVASAEAADSAVVAAAVVGEIL
jgi:hypothetical protein